MKKRSAFLLLTILLTSFTSNNELFVGKILYKNSFADLNQKDITDKLAPYFGTEQHYYIDGKNYKAYDEKNNWSQLYNSETNSYYSFDKDGTAKKVDGSTVTSKKYIVTKLAKKETIAGYDCQSVKIETDNATTFYFYCPTLKTDLKAFSKHNFGEWNKFLEVTEGALSLKFIMIHHTKNFIWTSVASEVQKQDLTSKDFEFPSNVKLKE